MKMVKQILTAILPVIIVFFLVTLPGAITKSRQKRIILKRMEDVKTLVRVYSEAWEINTINITNTQDLMALVELKLIKLHNPIPIDPTKPCYGVAVGESDNRILIEETTNVADNTFIVRGYFDGHVDVKRKNAAP